MHAKPFFLFLITFCFLTFFLILYIQNGKGAFTFHEILILFPGAFSFMGAISSLQTKTRRKKTFHSLKENPTLNTFKSNLYGGLIGGFLGGILVAFFYYHNVSMQFDLECFEIITLCTLVGIFMAGTVQLCITFFKIFNINDSFSLYIASMTGGILSSTILGITGMWLLGDNHLPFMGSSTLTIAFIAASIFIILGSLVYNNEVSLKKMLFSLLVSIIINCFFLTITYLIFGSKWVLDIVEEKVYSSSGLNHLVAGGELGGLYGFLLGSIMGITILIYKYSVERRLHY